MSNTVEKLVQKEIEFDLSPTDKGRKFDEILRLRGELEPLLQERKELGAAIKERTDEIEKICDAAKRGKELRKVECKMVKDFERNAVTYLYDGKVVEERAMEGDEREADAQTSLEDYVEPPIP